MIVETQTLFALSGISLLAGLLSSFSGNSGAIILPVLMMAGVPPYVALGTNKLYAASSLLTSSIHFVRNGLFNPRLWLAAIIATLFGSLIGVGLTQLIDPNSLEKIIPIFLALIAINMLLPKATYKPEAAYSRKPNSVLSTVMAGMIGVYSGFLGAGSGLIWTSLAMKLFKIDIIEACADSRFMCFISNISALGAFVVLGHVDYSLGFILAFMGAIGAFVGSRIIVKHGAKLIRPVLAVTTIALAIKLTMNAWF